MLAVNREYAIEYLADPDGILVSDPPGFAKKGRKSVGAQRQYSGTLGRVDNCQIATFLAYVTPNRDRVLIDRRLYLPQSWTDDPDRRAEAGVPQDVTFQTRPQQVQDMVEATRTAEVPFTWFTADEEFGHDPGLCDYLEHVRIPYVMGDTEEHHDPRHHRHPPRNRSLRPTVGSQRLATPRLRNRSKGHRIYDWAVEESAETDRQYLIRRSLNTGELAFYRCYNPNRAGFGKLVAVTGARWPIEECFGSSKNETRLDNYQVRTWNAWHRHIGLAMLAHTFLAIAAHKTKKGPTPDGQHNLGAQSPPFGA